MDKFGSVSSIYDIQLDQIKAVADAFAAINPEKDGWFTGTIAFRMVGGKVIVVDETKIVRVPPAAKYAANFAEQTETFPGH